MELTSQRFGRIVEKLREAAVTGGSEKRKAARTEVYAKVAVATLSAGAIANRFAAMTHDISTTGLGLLQSLPMEPGTIMVVELPEGRERALLIGVVRYCRAAASGIFSVGLEFTGDAAPELARRWADTATAEQKRIQDSILG